MKICYIADGSSIHAQRLSNHFASEGHEVHLICWKMRQGYDNSVHVHMLPRPAPRILPGFQYLSFLFWLIHVRRLVRMIKPDIVDGQYVTTYGFLAACSGFHPLVVTAWGSDILLQPQRNPLLKLIVEYALNKADLIVCRSSVAAEEISRLGGEVDKTRVILIGVDTARFRPMLRIGGVRQELAIDERAPVVISTRNLEPTYDVEALLKAAPLVLGNVLQARFVIAGVGAQQGYLQKLADSLDISESVQFVGWVPHADMPRYLSSSDVYVSTSLSDGTSNSLLEAMACELAPVVTDMPANRPWIEDGENGFLFPTRDYKTLASRIIYLINNQEKRKDFGKRSRKVVQQKAEQQTEIEKLERVYQELIENK